MPCYSEKGPLPLRPGVALRLDGGFAVYVMVVLRDDDDDGFDDSQM